MTAHDIIYPHYRMMIRQYLMHADGRRNTGEEDAADVVVVVVARVDIFFLFKQIAFVIAVGGSSTYK